MPVEFGASLEGVRALLPHRAITPATVPNDAEVTAWLEEYSATVEAVTGDLDLLPNDRGQRDRVLLVARQLVHFAAAALTELAGAPEQAGSEVTSYGAWLWERYESGLTQLDAQVLLLAAGADVDLGEGPIGEPAFDFPPAMNWAQVRW